MAAINTLENFLSEIFGTKALHVVEYLQSINFFNGEKELHSGQYAQVLFFVCIADDFGSGASINKAFNQKTIKLIETISKHLTSYQPDGNAQLDIRKLLWLEVSLSKVVFHFENQTVFAGKNIQGIENVCRINGDIFRQIYLSQFN